MAAEPALLSRRLPHARRFDKSSEVIDRFGRCPLKWQMRKSWSYPGRGGRATGRKSVQSKRFAGKLMMELGKIGALSPFWRRALYRVFASRYVRRKCRTDDGVFEAYVSPSSSLKFLDPRMSLVDRVHQRFIRIG